MRTYWQSNPLVAPDFLKKLPLLPDVAQHARIMLVVPHPDDETLGCAGLIQRITQAQVPFCLIMATDGNKRGKKVRRRKEVFAAMSRCGVTEKQFVFLDFPDGKLKQQQNLKEVLKKHLEDFQPTVVIVTDPDDIHADHAVLGKAIMELQPEIPSIQRIFGILIHYHRFPRPLGKLPSQPLLPPGRLVAQGSKWFNVELSPEEQMVKRQALSEFRSQLLTPFLRGLMLSFDRPNELYRELHG
jgi:LmbE family N-acetylglucosaminyl deacetylase